MKTTVPLALGAIALLALAGCTASPAPVDPDECSPAAATITWGSPRDESPELAGVQILSYAAASSDPTIETIDRELSTEFTESAVESLAKAGPISADDWKTGLLESARAEKGVRAGFGAETVVNDSSYVEISDPVEGVYVTSLASSVASIDFTVACSGLEAVEGRIRGVSGDDLVAVPLLCVPDEQGDGLPAQAAREYCPKA